MSQKTGFALQRESVWARLLEFDLGISVELDHLENLQINLGYRNLILEI
jgi:gamma-glutamylcyclotransferase (GGCT)/AIG2-like uncharacterized protein YtfP